MVSEKEKPDSKAGSFLTKQEVADDAGKSIAWVDDLIASGQLLITKWAPGKTGGVGIKRTDWAAFKESREVCPVKPIDAKLAEIAIGLERPPNGRDFHTAENSILYSVYRVAQELLRDRIRPEENTEIFWQPSLWEIISRIRKNLEVLFFYAEIFDGEPFTGAFLSKLIGRQLTFWDTLIKRHVFGNGKDALNPALMALALPAGMGLFVKTKMPGRDHPVKFAGANFQGPSDPFGNDGFIYNITSNWKSIPAPASRMDIHNLFNHRYEYDLKIDKFVEPVTADEQRHRADVTKAKNKASLEKLIDGLED